MPEGVEWILSSGLFNFWDIFRELTSLTQTTKCSFTQEFPGSHRIAFELMIFSDYNNFVENNSTSFENLVTHHHWVKCPGPFIRALSSSVGGLYSYLRFFFLLSLQKSQLLLSHKHGISISRTCIITFLLSRFGRTIQSVQFVVMQVL